MSPPGSGRRSGAPRSDGPAPGRRGGAAPASNRGGAAPASNRGGAAPGSRGGAESSGRRAGGGSGGRAAAGGRRSGPPGLANRGFREGDDNRAARATAERGLGGSQVEGRQAVRELLIAGRRKVREILLSSDVEPAPVLEDIVELAESRRVTVRQIGRGKFDTLAVTSAAQGVIARAHPLPEVELEDLLRRRKGVQPFLLALDGVTDPQNLGAILRSAECAGVTGVILPRHRAVHVTASVAKSAAGAIEYLPMALVGGLPTALKQLTDRGAWVVGLDGDAPASLYSLPLADEPVVLVLGAEGKGLSRLVRERCSVLAAIPMDGRLNSLNVASAASIACFDISRRRADKKAAQLLVELAED